jgi:hypothetical protein
MLFAFFLERENHKGEVGREIFGSRLLDSILLVGRTDWPERRIMKRIAIAVFVFIACASSTRQIWAHGFGGGFLGHGGRSQFSRGSGQWHDFHGSFGQPGLRQGFTTRFFLPQGRGFSRFDRFPHGQFFGPPLHFGSEGFAFRYFGFSGGGFAFDDSFGPAGPPPLGAPGPPPLGAPERLPFAPSPSPPVVISSPFFCFPHGLGFTDQALFLDHLQHFHGILPKNALAFCLPVGGGIRWIFFGF